MVKQAALQTDISRPPHKAVLSTGIFIREIPAFIYWWYVEMPTWYMGFIQRIAVLLDDTFSISLLVKTFFVPFHRDTSWVGRGFGIGIRLVYIPLALLISLLILALLTAVTLFWAFLPVISIYSLIRAPFT
jgi:hypothetical protein